MGTSAPPVVNPPLLLAPHCGGDPAPGHPGQHDASDTALIAAITGGDAAALDRLYVRYHPAAFAVAFALLRDPGASEDIVHDAFLSVWRGAAGYRPERGTLRSWLLTIVRNAAIDALRPRRKWTAIPSERQERRDASEDIAASVASAGEARRLRAAVQSLPPAQREAVAMAFFAGLTHGEIAARTGLPLGTVKGRVRLGLRRLRHDLGDLASGPGIRRDTTRATWK